MIATRRRISSSTMPPALCHAEKRTICPRFLEHGTCNVNPALGPRPFLIEAPLAIFLIGHEIRKAYDLSDTEERHACERIEFRIRLRISLHATGVDAELIMGLDDFARRIFDGKPASLCSSEVSNLREHADPHCGVERSIVDVANKIANFLRFGHVAPPQRGFGDPIGRSEFWNFSNRARQRRLSCQTNPQSLLRG